MVGDIKLLMESCECLLMLKIKFWIVWRKQLFLYQFKEYCGKIIGGIMTYLNINSSSWRKFKNQFAFSLTDIYRRKEIFILNHNDMNKGNFTSITWLFSLLICFIKLAEKSFSFLTLSSTPACNLQFKKLSLHEFNI